MLIRATDKDGDQIAFAAADVALLTQQSDPTLQIHGVRSHVVLLSGVAFNVKNTVGELAARCAPHVIVVRGTKGELGFRAKSATMVIVPANKNELIGGVKATIVLREGMEVSTLEDFDTVVGRINDALARG